MGFKGGDDFLSNGGDVFGGKIFIWGLISDSESMILVICSFEGNRGNLRIDAGYSGNDWSDMGFLREGKSQVFNNRRIRIYG